MKRLFYAALMAITVIACAKPASEAGTQTESTTAMAGETAAATSDTASTATAATATEEKPMSSYENKVAVVKTSAGEIHIRFFPDVAPNHVKNFLDLAQSGFYNGTKFHRVIPGFMIQGGDPNTKSGDPNSWGTGGNPGKNLKAEFNTVPHRRGIVSMARSQHPDSASSQFFIVVKDSTFLDNQYTVFGEVTKGIEVADTIVAAPRDRNDRPNNPTAIESVTIRDANEDEKGPTPKG